MGESELVLDSLGVDEALRLIAGSAASGPAGSGKREAGSGPREAAVAAPAGDSDWRAALRAAGATPDAPRATKPAAEKPLVPNAEKRPEEVSASRFPLPAPPDPTGITVGTPAGELFGGALGSLDSLEAIAKA